MPRKVVRKERGISEKEPGSGIWWVRYKIDGIEDARRWAAAATRSDSTNSAVQTLFGA